MASDAETHSTISGHPLDVVPNEVWGKIFRGSSKGDELNPFLLSAVCRDWRAVVLANTELWDTISIPFLTIRSDEDESAEAVNLRRLFQMRVDALEMWIRRAGARLLSIKLETFCWIHHESEVGRQVPRIIVAHASQIVSLDMHFYDEWFPLFRGVEFPQICALALHTYTEPPPEDTLDFRRSPRLSVLTAPRALIQAVTDFLPWSQIIEADLSKVDPLYLLMALSVLFNLERCSVKLSFSFHCDNVMRRGVGRRERPRLTALNLHAVDPVLAQIILDELPLTLQDLYLGMPENPSICSDPNDPGGFLLKIIPPFAGTLRSLSLRLTPIYLTAFRDLIHRLPGLENVEVSVFKSEKGFGDDFFLSCFATVGVLTSLSRLTFKGIADDVADETIMDVVQYRWDLAGGKGCVKIKDMLFQFAERRPPLDPEMQTKLTDMIDDGLNVIIEVNMGSTSLTLK